MLNKFLSFFKSKKSNNNESSSITTTLPDTSFKGIYNQHGPIVQSGIVCKKKGGEECRGFIKFFFYSETKKYGFIIDSQTNQEIYFKLGDVEKTLNKKDLNSGLKVRFVKIKNSFNQFCAIKIQRDEQ